MSSTETEVDAFEQWWDTFQPTGEPTTHGGPHIGNDPKMFETFGADLAMVRKAHETNPRTVWTLLDCDGELYVGAGYHFVNRIGYFITKKPWTEKDFEQDIRVD